MRSQAQHQWVGKCTLSSPVRGPAVEWRAETMIQSNVGVDYEIIPSFPVRTFKEDKQLAQGQRARDLYLQSPCPWPLHYFAQGALGAHRRCGSPAYWGVSREGRDWSWSWVVFGQTGSLVAKGPLVVVKAVSLERWEQKADGGRLKGAWEVKEEKQVLEAWLR